MKNILIIHASAGAGHQKAAEAVFDGIKSSSAHQARIIDGLDLTSQSFKNLYRNTYTLLISKVPWLWGIFFGIADVRPLLPLVRFVRRVQNSVNAKPLEEFLKKEQFDCIISTHFFPTEVVSRLKRTGAVRSKLITVVTDFDVHSIWMAPNVDQYAVASDWTKNKLASMGVAPEKIAVTGIPVNAKFTVRRDKKEMRRKLGLKEQAFTVLVATGSFGIGPIEKIIRAIETFQTVVVCGHNKSLFDRLSRIQRPSLKVCGLVNNMDELMAASDVMVSKPGGLSICEALASGLPMIFFNAIPGQETNNIRVLRVYGTGVSTSMTADIAETLEEYRSAPQTYLKAVEQTKVLAKPNAVQDIIKLI